MMVCRRRRESLPPCITRLYLVSLICKRNQLSCQLIFSVNSESNCSSDSLSRGDEQQILQETLIISLLLFLWLPRSAECSAAAGHFYIPPLFFSFSERPHSDRRPLITELHLFRNTHFQWPVAMEPGRPPSSRESASLPLFSERGLRVCSYNVWCYENKKQGSSLENGNNTRAMQEVLERVLLLPCLFDPPCFLPSVFPLFSSLLSLLVFSVEVLLFLMNYLPTPQCWLRCMSEHL